MYAFKGKRTNILIITDRLLYTAKLLCDFLNNYEDIDCNLICSLNDFAPDETGIPDILISAGYLENIDNWGIVESVRRSNAAAVCILWGMVDSCIIDFTDKYNFNEWFERTRPFEDLLEHIREFEDDIYEYNSIGIDLCSELLFSDDDYHIIAYTGNMIKVNSMGIFPLGKIRMKGFPYKAVLWNVCGWITGIAMSLRKSCIGIIPSISGFSRTYEVSKWAVAKRIFVGFATALIS